MKSDLQPFRELYSKLFSASLLLHRELRVLPQWPFSWQADRAFISSFRIILPIPYIRRGEEITKQKQRAELKRGERRPQHGRQKEQTDDWVGKKSKMRTKMEQRVMRRKCGGCCNWTINVCRKRQETVEEGCFVVMSSEAGWKEALINSLIKN